MDMHIALTVYFDGQFYSGLLEYSAHGLMRAARVVFGAEPSDSEVIKWVLAGYPGAVFSPVVDAPRTVRQPQAPPTASCVHNRTRNRDKSSACISTCA